MTAERFSGPELCRLTAREATAALKRGEVRPSELLEASWTRMDQVEPVVNATVIRADDRARAQLAQAPERAAASGAHRGWLAGLPVTIKDTIAVAGMRATSGSPAFADFVPDESDALIERLEARGAVIAGKTNAPEFGAGGVTFNAVFGATRNPWDTRRNPGGSSGGAAASLATGEAWLAHGSDLAGSLRTPAAYCGVVGLRPSPGRAGGAPVDSAFSPEAVQGPMARNVRDCAFFLDAMAGYDARHPISLEEPVEGFQAALERSPGPIRIAFSEDQGGFGPVEPPIRAALSAAMTRVAGAGVAVESAWPETPGLYDGFMVLRGVQFATIPAFLPADAQQHFKRTLRENIAFGRRLSAEQIYAATRAKSEIYHRMRLFFQDFDVLAGPVVGLEPGPIEEEYPQVVDGVAMADYTDWLRFSFLATMAGLPALSLPCGVTAAGLPVGLQLIGPPRGEARLLQAALALEERLGLDLSPIDPRTPAAPILRPRAASKP